MTFRALGFPAVTMGLLAVGCDGGGNGADTGPGDTGPADTVPADTGPSDGASTGPVSCTFDVQMMHVCTEFDPIGWNQAAFTAEQAACASNMGVYATAACDSANRSGVCTYTSTGTGATAGIPAGTVVRYAYYSLPTSQISAAAASCASALGGTWTNG